MVFLRSKMSFRQMTIVSGSIIGLVVALSLLTPGIKHRFVELFHSYNIKPENVAYDSTNIRMAIFDCTVSISKDNLLYGVGFENLQNNLNNCYKSNYDSSFYEGQSYMTHNYFFYILLSTGIMGLLLFLIYIINILRICLKSNLFLFKVFLLNVLVICIIEDYLYRHYGLLYFNLLLISFIQYSKNKESEAIDIS
jgi:O-antigen ligase